MRPRVTNEAFDPAVMLRKALAGAYPSAAHGSPNRAAEIAHWRGRAEAERKR